MFATVGDRLVVRGVREAIPQRDGEVLEVRGRDGRHTWSAGRTMGTKRWCSQARMPTCSTWRQISRAEKPSRSAAEGRGWALSDHACVGR